MDTAAISHRVADFLRKHPPFQTVADADLLELAARGRVRFHEPNEYILWQGEPHRMQVFVIQQGTVTLWDETGAHAELRDLRGAGDMLGIEQFNDADVCLYSARSSSDVVIYAFPAIDFEALILKYPNARHHVAAHSRVSADDLPSGGRGAPHAMYLRDLAQREGPQGCRPDESIRDGAKRLRATGADAIAIVDVTQRACGALTRNRILEWVAEGSGTVDQPISALARGSLPAVPPGASVADGVVAMATADLGVLAVTDDGSQEGRLQAIVTPRDLARVFGEEPVQLLQGIRQSSTTKGLGELNRRARGLILQYLTSAGAAEWLCRFAHLTDARILDQVLSALDPAPAGCWCFCGASGRGESLTRCAPQLVVIVEHDRDRARALAVYEAVLESLASCEYLPRQELSFDHDFYVASVDEWKRRYTRWMRDPILQQMYRARTLFDLRPIHGPASLWQDIRTTVDASVDREVVYVLANDCLASLPPLTFFQHVVIDTSGEQKDVFLLEQSALRPLVDVGRVFGMAARRTLGSSTRERLQVARTLLPASESIFGEASDTLGIVLWQQGRVGIAQGTSGAELPPSLLSRNDRHTLKSGFRPILRLLEFTADPTWLDLL